MGRLSIVNTPFLLGFERVERAVDRLSKTANDGYPPYNVEQWGEDGLRITIAVAGFMEDDLSVVVEDNQLVVRGKQGDCDPSRVFLYRGIASRQFQRSFVLVEGMEVVGAGLDRGLLQIDLRQLPPAVRTRTIEIRRIAETKEYKDVSALKKSSRQGLKASHEHEKASLET